MPSSQKIKQNDMLSMLLERLDAIEETLRLLLVHFVLNEAEQALLHNAAAKRIKISPDKKKSAAVHPKKAAAKNKNQRGSIGVSALPVGNKKKSTISGKKTMVTTKAQKKTVRRKKNAK